MRKERLILTISDSYRIELKDIVGKKLRGFVYGGGVFMHSNDDLSTVECNEFCCIVDKMKSIHFVSMRSINVDRDNLGSYSYLQLSSYHDNNLNHGFNKDFIAEKLLLRNRGLLYVNKPNTIIQSVCLYGTRLKNHVIKDEDFPKENTLVTLEIDRLIKFNLNDGSSFSVFGKGGNTLFQEWKCNDEFNSFIRMTQDSWGELGSLQLIEVFK